MQIKEGNGSEKGRQRARDLKIKLWLCKIKDRRLRGNMKGREEKLNGSLLEDLAQCPAFLPRTQYVKSYSDKCLYLITGKQSWNGANSNCHHHGGRLVQIQDRDKQDFIYNTLKAMNWRDQGVWIGATDHESEGTWKWTDGTVLSYGYWRPGEGPSHGFLFSKAGYEDCALMRLDDNGRWRDYDCGTALYHHTSICEYRKTTLPTTTTDMPTTTTTMPTTTTTTMPTTTTNIPTTTTTMPTTTTTIPTTTTTLTTTTNMPTATTMPTTTTIPTTTTPIPTTT
ncbi:ladderlectin-like, partial [Ylistrum balloti]|uniref:ladderlectin-like n=1 Tax=Ylistrum balloti TaxID=509963 RepID=UPI002905AAAC